MRRLAEDGNGLFQQPHISVARSHNVPARIISVNISKKKGAQKEPIPEAHLAPGHGMLGDVHAGPGDRQISLLALESIERQKEHFEKKRAGGELPHCPKSGPILRPGAFAENMTTRGIKLAKLPLGTRLLVGGRVILEVSKIGKECHRHCVIYKMLGDCIMPREGIFAKVIEGGVVKPGDEVSVHESCHSDDQ